MKSNDPMVEMVVVFKKDIPMDIARKVMDDQKRSYRTGMDSSRGKHYFYSTGPKFLVKVKPDEIPEFTEHFQSLSEVYEVYEANWKIIKD